MIYLFSTLQLDNQLISLFHAMMQQIRIWSLVNTYHYALIIAIPQKMHCPFSESSRNRSLSMPLMQESFIYLLDILDFLLSTYVPWICIILYDCIDNRGVPKGGGQGGQCPQGSDRIRRRTNHCWGGDVKKSRGGEKNSKHTISIFAPAPQIFSLQIPLIDNGDNSFHVFSQFFCFLMQK